MGDGVRTVASREARCGDVVETPPQYPPSVCQQYTASSPRRVLSSLTKSRRRVPSSGFSNLPLAANELSRLENGVSVLKKSFSVDLSTVVAAFRHSHTGGVS